MLQTFGVCFVLIRFVVNVYKRGKIVKHDQHTTRQRLIDGTIHIIAQDGLDKATTKLIGVETGINEVYIYRCFKDKEDMFAKTFEFLDEELFAKIMHHIPVMYIADMEYEARCWSFFSAIWRFFLDTPEKSITYIRYYHSPYFDHVSLKEHQERFEPLVTKCYDAFRVEVNVDMLLNHILITMMGFSMQVFNGVVPDNNDTAEYVFRLLYASARQFFKN